MSLVTIDADATRRALPFPALIDALRRAFAAGAEVPRRQVLSLGDPDRGGGTVLVMPAWRVGAYLGIKTVSVFPGNPSRGLAALHSSYVLHDATTGAPLALIDGDQITARRTAAASALAASFLARRDASRLLIVGAGRIASLLTEAMAAVRPIASIVVWSRRAEAAEALAADLRSRGFDARSETALESAVRSADIVSCATLSCEPLVHGRWLRPGTHLDLIGGFTPAMRESDAECFRHARAFVDTAEALEKSGDLLAAIAAGAMTAADVRGSLESLCRGESPGRVDAAEITVFKSVGTALEDLAAAELAFAGRVGSPVS